VKAQGSGFDSLTSQTTGIGLLTMRERVELAGGQLTIDAAEAHGTTIEAILPLDRASRMPVERAIVADAGRGVR
jgi:signal transduction histidine kinase